MFFKKAFLLITLFAVSLILTGCFNLAELDQQVIEKNQEISDTVRENYGDDIPSTREELIKLPGVGRKTANVILNTAFGQPTMAVDTHIFRVANRTGLALGKTPLIIERKLLKSVPKQFLLNAHHWLILHGRYTCKARNPNCAECIVRDLCRTGKQKGF